MIYLYPILIAGSRIAVIWAKKSTTKKIFMTSAQIFILLAILEITKKTDDKAKNR